jgi:hypothetical protein
MNELELYLVQFEIWGVPHYLTFWADGVNHALEQGKDANPNDTIIAVFKCIPVWDNIYGKLD